MLAIHDEPGSFSERWLEICIERGIAHTRCDMFADELLGDLREQGVSTLVCHPPMADRRAALVAQSVLRACSAAGIDVFPRLSDYWHFDDKIAQKYLFEALGIPTPATHVFLDKDSALAWIEQAAFPIVFKLRSGAGSINVSLLATKKSAIARVSKMFGRGYPATDALIKDLSTKIRLHRSNRDWLAVARRFPSTFGSWLTLRRTIDRERGYAYFQEFIPNNRYDTRVTVIGERAFAFRRMVRPGDFRASGSGSIDYDPEGIDLACVDIAFEALRRVGGGCLAFDFVKRASDGAQLVVEMSYAFKPEPVFRCSGHWDAGLRWHPGCVWPQDVILDDVLRVASR